MPMNLGAVGLVILAVLIVLGLVFWGRGRSLGAPLGGWRAGRINLAKNGFPLTRSNGYLAADVNDVLDRAYRLAADAPGRAEALEMLHAAQFAVARGGYGSMAVDLHVDAMIVALQTGRDLPVRPGSRRP
ncbi:MAG: hypothetical protein ACOH1Y_09620 [Propionicimonas sp.]